MTPYTLCIIVFKFYNNGRTQNCFKQIIPRCLVKGKFCTTGTMILWILKDGSYDYHKSSGPNVDDVFVEKLITKGNQSVYACVCMLLCLCVCACVCVL